MGSGARIGGATRSEDMSEPIDSPIWPVITANWRSDAPAFQEGSVSLTFAQLAEQIEAAARGLLAQDISCGDRVFTWLPNWWETAVLFLACTRIGAVFVPASTWLKPREVEYLLETADPALCFAANRFLGREYASELGQVARSKRGLSVIAVRGNAELSDGWTEFISAGTNEQLPPTSMLAGQMPALIQFTSGTTARAKAVVLSHASLVRTAYWVGRTLRFSAEDCMVSAMPYYHVGGSFHSLIVPLLFGCRAVTVERFDPAEVLRLIVDEKATLHRGIGTMLVKEMAHENFDPGRIKVRAGTTTGSPRFMRSVAENFIPGIANPYGLSEVTGCIALHPPDAPIEKRVVGGGPLFPGVEVRILDPDAGRVGEILVRGWSLMLGYLDPAQTAAAIDGDGWLHTGDLGRLTEDGRTVEYVGRKRLALRVAGENVAIEEIEALLELNPRVKAAAVVGVEDRLLGDAAFAFIMAPENGFDGAELFRWGRANFASYKVPRYFARVDELPAMSNGKIDRMSLKSKALEYLANGAVKRHGSDDPELTRAFGDVG